MNKHLNEVISKLENAIGNNEAKEYKEELIAIWKRLCEIDDQYPDK
jgi:hypothetical protein